MSDSLQPHESQHARPPCPSPTPRAYSDPCPSSRWCHPAISSSVGPFSSCPQSLAASGSFPVSQYIYIYIYMSSATLAPFQVLRSHVARGFPSGQGRLQTTPVIRDHSNGQHWVQALLDLCPRVPRSSEEVQFPRLATFEKSTGSCWLA